MVVIRLSLSDTRSGSSRCAQGPFRVFERRSFIFSRRRPDRCYLWYVLRALVWRIAVKPGGKVGF